MGATHWSTWKEMGGIEDDGFMSGIGEQWKDTRRLIVKSVGRSANFGCPQNVEILNFANNYGTRRGGVAACCRIDDKCPLPSLLVAHPGRHASCICCSLASFCITITIPLARTLLVLIVCSLIVIARCAAAETATRKSPFDDSFDDIQESTLNLVTRQRLATHCRRILLGIKHELNEGSERMDGHM